MSVIAIAQGLHHDHHDTMAHHQHHQLAHFNDQFKYVIPECSDHRLDLSKKLTERAKFILNFSNTYFGNCQILDHFSLISKRFIIYSYFFATG